MNTTPKDDEMSGLVINAIPDCSLVAATHISKTDPSVVLLIIHSGRDQLRFYGLSSEHARLIALATNAPYLEH